MSMMVGHDDLEKTLDWADLIGTLRDWYRDNATQAPARQVLSIQQPDGSEGSLLIMPAWVPGRSIGVKAVTFFPQNAKHGRPTINAGYLLFDGETGRMQAALDGDTLTARRTAAASALAADYLARKEAAHLLIVGTGQLAAAVAMAHSTVRSYSKVSIWGRDPAKSAAIAQSLCDAGLAATSVSDLEATCRTADVISTVTASTKPIILGEWLKLGAHLDLIGAFKQDMRESDDQAIMQAKLFVDNRESAALAGDLAQPLADGLFSLTHVEADLVQLCQGEHPGRELETEFTVFKSAGMAMQDLAAATLAHDQLISG